MFLKSKLILLISMIALLIVALPVDQALAQTATGRVCVYAQAQNSDPINNIILAPDAPFVVKDSQGINVGSFVTGADGRGCLDVDPGTYTVNVVPPWSSGSSVGATVTVSAGQVITLNFRVGKRQSAPSGLCVKTRTRGGQDISGIQVTILDSLNKFVTSFVTDEHGNYCVYNLANGNYTLQATTQNPNNQILSSKRKVGVSGSATTPVEFIIKSLCVNQNGIAGCQAHIQGAIDDAKPGDRILVYPGSYSETASARTVLTGTAQTNGPHQFGLFIGGDKNGITLQGVDANGHPINDYRQVATMITTNATNNFGYSGIFVEGDNVTIDGLGIGPNLPEDNKTIEIIGDGFTLSDSVVDVPAGGSVYIGDWRASSTQSYIKKYRIEGNWLKEATSIDIANGAGLTGPVGARVIKKNKFTLNDCIYDVDWPVISFSGSDTGIPWFVSSIGGAVIAENEFSGGTVQYIRARGTYDNSQFDWKAFWNNNKYDHAVVVGPNPPGDLRPYSYDWTCCGTLSGTFNNVRRIGASVEDELANAEPGDWLLAKPGQFVKVSLDSIAQADKQLAIDAIALATANHGDPRKIAHANDELGQGDKEFSKGNLNAARGHYRNAYNEAMNSWKDRRN